MSSVPGKSAAGHVRGDLGELFADGDVLRADSFALAAVLAGGGVLVYLIYTGKLGGKIIEKAGDKPADKN